MEERNDGAGKPGYSRLDARTRGKRLGVQNANRKREEGRGVSQEEDSQKKNPWFRERMGDAREQ